MRQHQESEWDDDGEDDPEAPDPADRDDDDSPSGYEECPKCGKDVWEEAEWCPHCGEVLTSAPRREWPLWVWVGLISALLVMLLWAMWG